jgi:hypothetical protein
MRTFRFTCEGGSTVSDGMCKASVIEQSISFGSSGSGHSFKTYSMLTMR